jgi:putative membrane protein
MKKYSNSTMRLTRILKNGVAVVVAVIAVNTLQAQPATPNTTPNQSGGQVNNSSTAIGNNNNENATQTPPQNATSPANNETPAANSESTSHRAKEFIKDAAQANSAEIALSQVAQAKAQNSDVKQLAQMMVTDHQTCNQTLQGIAQAHGVAIDQSLDWVNQHEVNRLQKADTADFDKDYTKIMLKDHVKAIKMFQKAADEVKDSDVKEFAANTLPTLRNHLRHAEDAARAVGLDDSTVNSIVKDIPTGGTN